MDYFPEEGLAEDNILKELKEAKQSDISFSSGRVFGSMCTGPLDIGRRVYEMFLEANLGNPGLCMGTKEIEKKVHKAVASLIHVEGCESLSVGGATEGNIIALWRARNIDDKRKVILPESAHFSFQKACNLLDMEPVFIPLDKEYKMNLKLLKEELDNETAAVVAVAGTTELGQIDPIKEIANISGDTFFHVDAAFGGFVIPFLHDLGYKMPNLDFGIEGIDTIALDPHKMGISPVPLGLFYSKKESSLSIEAPYLTGREQKTIRGTRSSASIPAFWATLNYLGKKGYRRIISECMDNTNYLVERMKELGFEPIIDPVMNIASFHHEDPIRTVKNMQDRGYNISRTIKPQGLRFVVMPHVTKGNIENMLKILEDIK